MGTHRSTGHQRIRFSRGVIVGAVAVVVVIALVVAWVILGKQLDDDSTAAATQCVKGNNTVAVIADPQLVRPLQQAAEEFAKTRPVIRDYCVAIDVRPGDAKVTFDGLRGAWNESSLGDYPAAWVPASSLWSSRLLSARSSIIDGTPTSLVSSPVVIAAPSALSSHLTSLSWKDLPELQRTSDSLAKLGLPQWGSLGLAMPRGPQSDATTLVAAAVLRATAGASLTPRTLRDTQVLAPVRTLVDSAPRGLDSSQLTALTARPSAKVHALPTTEQALHAAGLGDAITAVKPTGQTPQADYPIVGLTGERVSPTAAQAISSFFRFVRSAKNMQLLTAAGFSAPVTAASPDVLAALAQALHT